MWALSTIIFSTSCKNKRELRLIANVSATKTFHHSEVNKLQKISALISKRNLLNLYPFISYKNNPLSVLWVLTYKFTADRDVLAELAALPIFRRRVKSCNKIFISDVPEYFLFSKQKVNIFYLKKKMNIFYVITEY